MKIKLKLIRIIRYISDGILPLLFWIFVIFAFDAPDVAVLTILSALIHELGHLIVILSRNVSFSLRGHLSGFRIAKASSSYNDHLLILLGGPLANFAVYLFGTIFSSAMNGYMGLFGNLNLITALSNLMPIEGYDGYGIIRSILERYRLNRAERILEHTSFGICVAITFLALYLLMRYNIGYWIFGLFLTLIMVKIRENLKMAQ